MACSKQRREDAGHRLQHAQRAFDVPVLGAVEPGARAAARVTHNRKVGVIATKATVESGVYSRAIRNIDAGITVFSTATPRFVEIVEQGLRMSKGPIEDLTSQVSKVYIRPAFQEIAQDYLDPLRRGEIDTLVLGCTHFPLLLPKIQQYMLAKEVAATLGMRGQLAAPGNHADHRFFTSSEQLGEFQSFGSRVFGKPLPLPQHIQLP